MNRVCSILVVEDESRMRALLKHYLQSAGHRVITAENGVVALRCLNENRDIGLILLDIRLPVSSGLDAFESIKRDFTGLKIIVSSVYSKTEQKFLLGRADDYFDKSESFSSLIDKVNRLLLVGA